MTSEVLPEGSRDKRETGTPQTAGPETKRNVSKEVLLIRRQSMELKGKTVLVWGGAGLVGLAICRELIGEGIKELIVTSLFQDEVDAALAQLKHEYGKNAPSLKGVSGNLFVRAEQKDISRRDLLQDAKQRAILLQDLFDPLNRDILQASEIYLQIMNYKPDVIVDCVNTATAISYQNLYGASKTVLKTMREEKSSQEIQQTVEQLLCMQYLPQLIRHIQILLQSMIAGETKCYLKIGTCGTGGMGLNIPYTHSEDKPSQMLLSKSAIAGAHSMLLFLMGRTPDAPVIKELKPAAAIAWKKIGYGPITKKKEPIYLQSTALKDAVLLEGQFFSQSTTTPRYITDTQGKPRVMEAPYIDLGENGLLSLGEFETITDESQMEFITPEEIAKTAIWEIMGRNTGNDIVAALDTSIMGPTYRAGHLRKYAISYLQQLVEEHGAESIAFEILGPPRLSKLLYEAHLLKRLYGTLQKVLTHDEKKIAAACEELLLNDEELRSRIISIGIPLLLADGKKLLRGKHIAIPAESPVQGYRLDQAHIDTWAHDGWIDLRVENFSLWKERIEAIIREWDTRDRHDTSSHGIKSLHEPTSKEQELLISESKLVSWIFAHEEKGSRMKA